ncbi:hypothetical protein ABK040_013599 [Willaertia magna]
MQLGVDMKNSTFEPELNQILNDKIIEVAPGASQLEGTNLANERVENIASVSCGGRYSSFVTKYGQVFGFGYNENYQIGTDIVDDTRGVYATVFFKEELMKYDNE